MQTVTVTLTTAGLDVGPFNMFTDADGFVTPIETNVSRTSLLAGYTTTLVPSSATIIKLRSIGTCENYINFTIE